MKKLLILTLSSSLLFCHGALAAQLQDSSISEQSKVKSTPVKSANAIKYDASMKAGYNAFDKKDFKTALANFKSALSLRPNNMYATKAIQITEKRLAGK
jgi:Flp pilus assembly protein TadD